MKKSGWGERAGRRTMATSVDLAQERYEIVTEVLNDKKPIGQITRGQAVPLQGMTAKGSHLRTGNCVPKVWDRTLPSNVRQAARADETIVMITGGSRVDGLPADESIRDIARPVSEI